MTFLIENIGQYNLTLVGTTHLIKREEIEQIINIRNPDVIGVELCQTRLQIFVYGQQQMANPKDETLLGKISEAIKNKAQEEKVEYGSDMTSAARIAIERKIPLVLVDRDVREVQALMQKIPIEEQIGFMKELQDFSEKSLTSSTENIDENKVIENLKTNYPVAYEFLIKSRESYILNQILKMIIKNPGQKIVVFLGRGHVKSIKEQLL